MVAAVPSIFQPPINRLEPITRDYVAGDDCQVFLDGSYMDQVASLQYQVLNTKKPVYGYHSEFLDGMMIGQETVYGRLVVYKTMHNYLSQVASGRDNTSFQGVTEAGSPFNSHYHARGYELSFLDIANLDTIPPEIYQLLVPLMGDISLQAYQTIIQQLKSVIIPGIDPNMSVQVAARREKIKIAIAYKKLMAEQIDKYYGSLERFWESANLTEGIIRRLTLRTGERTGANPSSYNDKSDLAMHPFDLSVFMGVIPTQELGKDYAIVGQLEACYITAANATYTTTAEPLGTSYDFFARRYTETYVTG